MQFRGVHSLVVGKPQSQNACSPQLEEEEDHGKMYQQLYAVNLCSMQRHGNGSYSLYVVAEQRSLALSWRLAINSPLPLSDVLTCRGYEGSDRGRDLILYTGRRVPPRLTGKDKRG